MAKYAVRMITYAHLTLEVEADSRDEAVSAATEISPRYSALCGVCSGSLGDWDLSVSDEWDVDDQATDPGEGTET